MSYEDYIEHHLTNECFARIFIHAAGSLLVSDRLVWVSVCFVSSFACVYSQLPQRKRETDIFDDQYRWL